MVYFRVEAPQEVLPELLCKVNDTQFSVSRNTVQTTSKKARQMLQLTTGPFSVYIQTTTEKESWVLQTVSAVGIGGWTLRLHCQLFNGLDLGLTVRTLD